MRLMSGFIFIYEEKALHCINKYITLIQLGTDDILMATYILLFSIKRNVTQCKHTYSNSAIERLHISSSKIRYW